jgi:hypothetical protein
MKCYIAMTCIFIHITFIDASVNFRQFILNGTFNFLLKLAGWDFGYCGHYWPILPAPDDR